MVIYHLEVGGGCVVVLGIEEGSLVGQDKCSTTESHPDLHRDTLKMGTLS